MSYFDESVGRVKIQTTSKISQRYYSTKCLIRDLLPNTPNCFLSFFFVTSIQFVACALRGNLCNRSSRVQILRDICTRLGRYLYSTYKVQLDNTYMLFAGLEVHIGKNCAQDRGKISGKLLYKKYLCWLFTEAVSHRARAFHASVKQTRVVYRSI